MKMRFSYLIFCVLALALSGTAPEKPAQGKKYTKKEEHRTVAQVLDRTVTNLERDFVPAAEAMPEDKYGFAPTEGEFKGVRNFGQQVKHVAAVNDEAGPASITTKADILKYLHDSFVYVHKAIETINDKNLVETVKSPFGEGSVTRLGLATSVAWHGFDHYGQMVEYLRMNGIVPPASR